MRRMPSGVLPTIQSLEFRGVDEYTSRELTVEILKMFAMGIIAIGSFAAPNLAQLLKYFPDPKQEERKRIARKMRYLEEGGYLSKTGQHYVLTRKGKSLLSEERVWDITIPLQKTWDGRWHLILFDLPATYTRTRQILRARLEELGFVLYQYSVYVHHQDMREALLPFLSYYHIAKHVRLIEATWVAGEETLMKHFKVKRKSPRRS